MYAFIRVGSLMNLQAKLSKVVSIELDIDFDRQILSGRCVL